MRSRLPRKKAFIAVKKSTNSFAVWCHTRYACFVVPQWTGTTSSDGSMMALGIFPVKKKHHCSVQACHCFFRRSSCSTKLEDVEYPCSSCIWRRGGGIVWIFWDCSVWTFQVEDSPYDPEQMVFMNYGEYANQKVRSFRSWVSNVSVRHAYDKDKCSLRRHV